MNMFNVRRKITNGNWRCLVQVSILSWPPLRDRAQGAGNIVAVSGEVPEKLTRDYLFI